METERYFNELTKEGNAMGQHRLLYKLYENHYQKSLDLIIQLAKADEDKRQEIDKQIEKENEQFRLVQEYIVSNGKGLINFDV